MDTISQLRKLVNDNWTSTLVDRMAKKLAWTFSDGSVTVRVDTPECSGEMPVIPPLDELYEAFQSIGFVNKVDKEGCKCNMPERISSPAYSLDVPYLNQRAKEMHERLRDGGFYDGDI